MIAVTGATGNIGAEVLRLLLEANERVRVLVRDPKKMASLKDRVEVHQADLMKPETLPAAFAGATKAFILVADIHDIPTASGAIFQAAERAGVRHVVFVSSGTINITPPTTIGGWHLEGERLLKATSLQWTMLRPGNFASNSLRWAGPIKAQGAVYQANASHRSAVIDPRDIAAVAAKALSTAGHEGKTYVLTGPTAITAAEQVNTLGAALGKTLKLVEVPEAGARAGMLKAGMSETLADAVLQLTRPGHTLEQLVTTTVADVTGRPARSFEQWARDHVGAFA
jgi:uncharacterized protein YbjT (DUF2867 family)